MRSREERQIVAFLAAGDVNASQIAELTKIPRSTVRGWLRQPSPKQRQAYHREFDPATLPQRQYSYLLGFYLGDGCISSHPREVYRLRIKTDSRYLGLIAECATAMAEVMPQNQVLVQQLPYNAVEIACYSKRWPLLLPQHGPGQKHKRRIELVEWQQQIVDRHPREFLRGLIHSDGCRVLNRVNGKDYPRYFFTQVSDDIRELFCQACRRLGIEYTRNNWKNISIARASSVALLIRSSDRRGSARVRRCCACLRKRRYSRARRLSRCATG